MGLRNPFRFTIHPDDQRAVHRRRGLEHVGGDQHRQGRQLRLAVLRGRRRGEPGARRERHHDQPPDGQLRQQRAAPAPPAARSTRRDSAPCARRSSPTTTAARTAPGTSGGASANGGRVLHRHGVPAAVPERALHPRLQPALDPLPHLRRAGPARRSTTSAARRRSGMVQVLTGPDTNLYVVVLAGAGSQVRRIRYIAGGNTPPTAVANATPTIGTAPLAVTFSSLGSFDPDAQPLSYSWTFGDGGTSTQQHPTHTYTRLGCLHRHADRHRADGAVRVAHRRGGDHRRATSRRWPRSRRRPTARRTRSATSITYSGSGTLRRPAASTRRSCRGSCACTTTSTSTSTCCLAAPAAPSTIIEHGDNTFYELCLTATVPPSLTDTQCVNLLPETTPDHAHHRPAGPVRELRGRGPHAGVAHDHQPGRGLATRRPPCRPSRAGSPSRAGADGEPSHVASVRGRARTPTTYTARVREPAAGRGGAGRAR